MKVTIKSFESPALLSTMPHPPGQARSSLLERQKQDIAKLLADNSLPRGKEVKDPVNSEGSEDHRQQSTAPPTWTLEEIEGAQEPRESGKPISMASPKTAYRGPLPRAIPPWTGPAYVDAHESYIDTASENHGPCGSPMLAPMTLKISSTSGSSSRAPLRDITPPSWIQENQALRLDFDVDKEIDDNFESKSNDVSPLYLDSSVGVKSVGGAGWKSGTWIDDGKDGVLEKEPSRREQMQEVENGTSVTETSTQEILVDLHDNCAAKMPAVFELLGLDVDQANPHEDAKKEFLEYARQKEAAEISQAIEEDITYTAAHRVIVSNIAAGADDYDVAEMFDREAIPVHEIRMLRERENGKDTQVALVDLGVVTHLEHAEFIISRIFGLKVEIRRAIQG